MTALGGRLATITAAALAALSVGVTAQVPANRPRITGIDHIVQFSPSGTEHNGGATNLLGQERRDVAVLLRHDVVTFRNRRQEVVAIDHPRIAALKLNDLLQFFDARP